MLPLKIMFISLLTAGVFMGTIQIIVYYSLFPKDIFKFGFFVNLFLLPFKGLALLVVVLASSQIRKQVFINLLQEPPTDEKDKLIYFYTKFFSKDFKELEELFEAAKSKK